MRHVELGIFFMMEHSANWHFLLYASHRFSIQSNNLFNLIVPQKALQLNWLYESLRFIANCSLLFYNNHLSLLQHSEISASILAWLFWNDRATQYPCVAEDEKCKHRELHWYSSAQHGIGKNLGSKRCWSPGKKKNPCNKARIFIIVN